MITSDIGKRWNYTPLGRGRGCSIKTISLVYMTVLPRQIS